MSGTDRGTVPALTYVLAIGITSLLIAGLLITANGYLTDRREQVVRNELEVVGERLAAEVVAADQVSDGGGRVAQRTTVPTDIAGAGYHVSLADCPTAGACLRLESADPDVNASATVPVNNRSDIRLARVDPRTIRIVTEPGAAPPPNADADVRVAPSIGVARDVDLSSGAGAAVSVQNRPPIAKRIVYTPAPPSTGENVTFVARANSPDGDPLTYRWDLDGDGIYEVTGNESEASVVQYKYTSPGTTRVTMEVADPQGASDRASTDVRVSGLVYLGDAETYDADANGVSGGVSFTVRNEFGQQITITELLVEPADDGVERLFEDAGPNSGQGNVEVYADAASGDTGGYVEYGDDPGEGAQLPNGGYIVDFDRGGIQQGGNPTVSDGNELGVELAEFVDGSGVEQNLGGENIDVGVRYRINNGGTVQSYVTEFTATPDKPDLRVDGVSMSRTVNDVTVEVTGHDDDGNLDTVDVQLYDQSVSTVHDTATASFSSGTTDTVSGITVSSPGYETIENDYIVIVTVEDTNGNTAVATAPVPNSPGGTYPRLAPMRGPRGR